MIGCWRWWTDPPRVPPCCVHTTPCPHRHESPPRLEPASPHLLPHPQASPAPPAPPEPQHPPSPCLTSKWRSPWYGAASTFPTAAPSRHPTALSSSPTSPGPLQAGAAAAAGEGAAAGVAAATLRLRGWWRRRAAMGTVAGLLVLVLATAVLRSSASLLLMLVAGAEVVEATSGQRAAARTGQGGGGAKTRSRRARHLDRPSGPGYYAIYRHKSVIVSESVLDANCDSNCGQTLMAALAQLPCMICSSSYKVQQLTSDWQAAACCPAALQAGPSPWATDALPHCTDEFMY